jgi:hypothetical protein
LGIPQHGSITCGSLMSFGLPEPTLDQPQMW